jgi:hypothetical protein
MIFRFNKPSGIFVCFITNYKGFAITNQYPHICGKLSGAWNIDYKPLEWVVIE